MKQDLGHLNDFQTIDHGSHFVIETEVKIFHSLKI